MRNKKYSVYTIGTPTIIMVLVILCLVTFATLSMVSAKADFKLSEKLSERTENYYEASSKAQINLKNINEIIRDLIKQNVNENFYDNLKADEELNKLGQISITEEGTVLLDYTEAVSKDEVIEITLKISENENEKGEYYDIIRYKTVSLRDWEADNKIDIFIP